MNLSEILQSIEQYKNEGNDMEALLASAQGLVEPGKTPLGLNHWALGDKPRMEQFNADNMRVDALIGQLREELGKKADKEIPEFHSITYSEGFSKYSQNRSEYFKQHGVCHIVLNAKKDSGYIANTEIIATMPTGFRLSGIGTSGFYVPCVFYGGAASTEPGLLLILTDGTISVATSPISKSVVLAAFSYRTDLF